MWPAIIAGGGALLGGLLQGNAARDAATTQAQSQLQSAKIAADAARFTPIGVTSRFGASQFGYDPTGRLSTAGYTLTPEMKAYQDRMMSMAGQGLGQYEQGQQLNQPLMQGTQGMMQLGQGYLGTSPQEQAAKYMQEQQALLAPGRARENAAMATGMFNTGRTGLALGGTAPDAGGFRAANPELEAMYNARAMQDAQLAAQATQGGQQYATFGAGMLGAGSNTLRDYYQNQTAAAQPYQTAMGLAQGIEGLGQGMMDVGAQLGGRQAAAGATQGQMLQQGGNLAAGSQAAANAYSPMGSLLQGAGGMLQNYGWPTQGAGTNNAMLTAPMGSYPMGQPQYQSAIPQWRP